MPIQYTSPFSQFVDPGSTEIAEDLRNRFLTNYSTASKLEQEMAMLQAAPFEGDRNLRNQLVSSTQGTLNSLADKGNYEHMTIPVMSAAKEYTIKSQPIQENRTRYQTYLEELDKARVEGKIDYEDYQGTLNLSTMNYTGLVQNPDGTYGNMFNGLTYVERPDIQKMINEQIKMVASDLMGEEIKELAVGPDGRYSVKTSTKQEFISPEKIQLAISSVFADPQVQAYLNRKGEIRTAGLTESQLLEIKSSAIADLQVQRRSLDESLTKAKTAEERGRIQQQIDTLTLQAASISNISDPEQLRSLAMQREMSDIVSNYSNAAMASSFVKREDSTIMDYDALWLKNQEGNSLSGITSTKLINNLFEQQSPSGVNYNQLTSSTMDARNNVKELLSIDSLNAAGIDTNIFSPEDIMNMPYEQIVTKVGKEAADHILKRRNLVVENQNIVDANNMLMQETQEALGFTPEKMLSTYKGITGAPELLGTISSELNVSELEAASILNSYLQVAAVEDASVSKSVFNPFTALGMAFSPIGVSGQLKVNTLKARAEALDNVGLSNEVYEKISNILERPEPGIAGASPIKAALSRVPWNRWDVGNKEFNGVQAEDILDDMWLAGKDMENTMSKEIKNRTRTQYSGSLSPSLPGMTSTELKAIQTLLPKGGNINTSLSYLNPFTGQLQSSDLLLKDLKSRGVPAAINFDPNTATQTDNVKFDIFNFGIHGATMKAGYADKDGNKLDLVLPISENLSTPSYTSLLQNPSYQFIRKVAAQNGIGVKNVTIPVTLEDGTVLKLAVNLEQDYYQIIQPDGTRSVSQNLTSALEPEGSISNLFVHGARF